MPDSYEHTSIDTLFRKDDISTVTIDFKNGDRILLSNIYEGNLKQVSRIIRINQGFPLELATEHEIGRTLSLNIEAGHGVYSSSELMEYFNNKKETQPKPIRIINTE